MSAVTQYHIQQDNGNFRIAGFYLQAPDAQVVVHHWVQATDSKLVLPQVDECMLLADQRVSQTKIFIQWSVGVNRRQIVLQDEQSLICQGSA